MPVLPRSIFLHSHKPPSSKVQQRVRVCLSGRAQALIISGPRFNPAAQTEKRKRKQMQMETTYWFLWDFFLSFYWKLILH